MSKIESYKPAVMNSILLFIAGVVWAGVGILLLHRGGLWLAKTPRTGNYLFAGAGLAMALLVHHFGFLRIADRNVKRILQTQDKKCVFSFIPFKSYLIIAVMVAIGTMLRHSIIPKPYLAVVYIGIGLALFLSSIRYIRIFLMEISREQFF